MYRTVGSSADLSEVENLYKAAKQEIEELTGQQKLPYDFDKEKELLDIFFNRVEDLNLLGPELVLGKLFNEIHQVQQISYEHTLKILDNCLTIVFYDVTIDKKH